MIFVVFELAEVLPFAPDRSFALQIFNKVGKELLLFEGHFHNPFLDLFPEENTPRQSGTTCKKDYKLEAEEYLNVIKMCNPL